MTLQDSITLNVYGATQGQVTVLIANIQEVIIIEEKNNYSIKVVLNSGRAYRIVDSLGNHTYNTLTKALVAKQELLDNIDKALTTKLNIDTEDPEVRSDESVPSTKFFLDKLDKKVDSSPDKGLSTNDYTNEDKAKVDRLTLTGEQQSFLSGDGTYRKPLINWDTHVYNKPSIPDVAQLELAIDSKIDKKDPINPGTKPKISYDENGLVVGGESLTKDDIPELPASKITSGVFSESQIPELPASKITNGVLDPSVIPNIAIHKVVDLQEELLSLRESVEGKPRARVFATKSELDAWLLVPENVALLQIGDNFYIEETGTPDYWWNGTTIKELETEKVDLTEYAKKAELLTLGTTSNDAYRGDLGQIAYNHSQSAHAPANAQKNSDITKAEIEAKLTGEISSHSHALPNHDHDDRYYTKSETYTMAQTAARIKDSDGQTKELKSITTEPTGAFVDGDLYYNSNTKALYFYRDSEWELTGHGAPIEGVIYSFNGNLYFWNAAEADLIQIGGEVDLSNYYTTTEIDTKLTSKANTTHSHTISEIIDFPTSMPPTAHDHNSDYYTKSETYTRTQIDGLVRNSTGKTKELKSVTTEPTGTFVDGDLYYNSSTKELYYYRGSVWELTGGGTPIEGVVYSCNGKLYFWNEAETDLIQINPQGASGADGKEVELQKSTTHIQWRYVGDSTWINLVALSDLKGADGVDGSPGADGVDGKSVELQKNTTHIQWRYVGDTVWNNLVALTDLKGADGIDGKSIELQKTSTHIQWRQTGGTWANLIALADLVEDSGEAIPPIIITIESLTDLTPQEQTNILSVFTPILFSGYYEDMLDFTKFSNIILNVGVEEIEAYNFSTIESIGQNMAYIYFTKPETQSAFPKTIELFIDAYHQACLINVIEKAPVGSTVIITSTEYTINKTNLPKSNNATIIANGSSDMTITIALDATIPIGTVINVLKANLTTLNVNIAAGSGVTIKHNGVTTSPYKIPKQYQGCSLYKETYSSWYIVGPEV